MSGESEAKIIRISPSDPKRKIVLEKMTKDLDRAKRDLLDDRRRTQLYVEDQNRRR